MLKKLIFILLLTFFISTSNGNFHSKQTQINHLYGNIKAHNFLQLAANTLICSLIFETIDGIVNKKLYNNSFPNIFISVTLTYIPVNLAINILLNIKNEELKKQIQDLQEQLS